jgi:hypothetical protein
MNRLLDRVPGESGRKKLGVVMAAAAGVVFALSIVIGWSLDNAYVTRPREPNPALGRTEPYVIKSATVYLAPAERELLTWLMRFEMGSGAVVLLGLVLGARPARRRARP